MARAMTAGELTKVRSGFQASKLYLAIHNPEVVFQCRVNQTFTSLDRVVEVAYDNATGDYTDILPGMTAWVGTSAGSWDLGQVRIRKNATSGVLYVGENADVAWGDDAYITVVDEFGMWARHPRVLSDSEIYMDWDVEYDDQHENCAPVPIFEHQVLWLTGASVETDLDAGDSWCPTAGSKSYLWTASGGTLTNETTATPTFEATAAGVYRIGCTVTVGSASKTGYRYIFVFDDENMPFEFIPRGLPGGSYDRGGWEMSVSVTGDAALSVVRDRALCILFSLDYYDAVEGSIGPVAGSENIIFVGWISGESLNINPVQSAASFDIQGPHSFISTLEEFIDGIETTAGTPDAWTNIQNLTVDKCLWHLITWRSTLSTMMSVYLTDDTRQARALQTGNGDLWSQISRNAAAIAARPCCDRYGRLFVRINQQLIPEADRTGIPDVMTMTKEDWQGEIRVGRNVVSRNSQVVLSGVKYETGTEGSALFSLSPGHTFKRFGSTTTVERLLLSSQEQANELAGLLLGWMNHEYDFEITVAGNNRFVDITPEQYISVNIQPEDNNRGITYEGRVVVREVSLEWREKESFLHPIWVGEQESFPENSTDGDVPEIDDWDSTIPDLPDLPDLPDDDLVILDDPTIAPANQPKVVVGSSASHGVFYTRDFDADSPTYYLMNEGFLSTDDKENIRKMIVTPNGAIWILCHGAFQRIYRAAGVGGAWQLMVDGDDMTYPLIIGMGYNPLVSEQIAFALTDTGSFGVSSAEFYLANSGGYTKTADFLAGGAHLGDISFLGSNWFFCNQHGLFGNVWFYKFSAAGAIITSADITTNPGQSPATRFLSPLATTLFQRDSSGAGGWNILNPSTLAATRHTDLTFSMNFQGVSFSPTGQIGMGSSTETNTPPYKSDDSGATWSNIGSVLSTGSDIWENCGDNFRWIFGGGMTIKLTMDAGESVPINKTGNLTVIAPLVDVTGLKFIE